MSLVETLLALLLLGVVGGAMTVGVLFANTQFTRSMMRSEAKILYSTLQNIISVELENTGHITVRTTDEAGAYDLVRYFSTYYANDGRTSDPNEESNQGAFDVTAPASGRGYDQPVLQYTNGETSPLLSSTSYTYGMGAKVGSVKYYESSGDPDNYRPAHYHVDLRIYNKSGETLYGAEFDVLPLGEMTEERMNILP